MRTTRDQPQCPACGSKRTRCINTAVSQGFRLRRRRCLECDHILFTAHPCEEVIPYMSPELHPLWAHIHEAAR